MTYGRPGVYISETLIPAPLGATGTANAAGAAVGAFEKGPETLTLVRSWYDFAKNFGGYNAKYPATFGVAQFFNNGGGELYVKRVLQSDAVAAYASLPATSGTLATVTALSRGTDGNNLRVQVTNGPTINSVATFNLTVYKEVQSAYLYPSTSSNTDSTNDAVVEQYTGLITTDVTASNFIETVVNNSSAYIKISGTDTTKTAATQAASAVVPLTNGSNSAANAYVAASDFSTALATDGTSQLDQVDRPLVVFAPEVYAKFYVDQKLQSVTDATAATAAATATATVHNALVTWANGGQGFAVLDTPPSYGTSAATTYASTTITTKSSQGALYYPNYYIGDPLGATGALRKVGPASAAAGLYISTDKSFGPFKAPAGVQANVRGALSLERTFSNTDLDTLNSATVPLNAIRNLPGAGIVVMGARTLLQDGTANRYVNMRRSLIYIKKRLRDITQFAVMQNNDYKLWAQLSTSITVFLNEYRNQGGLRGISSVSSFYVKVDAENNTPTTIALGEVHVEVGVALQYPAEFVVINLSQITAA
jgi:hypothetical protein